MVVPKKEKKKTKLSLSLVNEMKLVDAADADSFWIPLSSSSRIFCSAVRVNGIRSLSLSFTLSGSHLNDFKLKHDSWDAFVWHQMNVLQSLSWSPLRRRQLRGHYPLNIGRDIVIKWHFNKNRNAPSRSLSVSNRKLTMVIVLVIVNRIVFSLPKRSGWPVTGNHFIRRANHKNSLRPNHKKST